MAGVVVATSLTSAVVKMACDKLSSAITEQVNLAWNFSDDLEDMKGTMESMDALFEDAEKQSVKNKSVGLWLKRLKHAAIDISDMMDDCQDIAKMQGMLPSLAAQWKKKQVLANKMKNMRKELKKINNEGRTYNFTQSATAIQGHQRYDKRETMSSTEKKEILGRDVEKKEIINILSASHREDGTVVLPIYGLGGIGKSTLAQLVYNDNQLKYEHRLWVYVSESFDLKKIGRSIISQLPTEGGNQNLDSLQKIKQCLNGLLPNDKKILIVLDDIWQEDTSELDRLKVMLHGEKKGSMIDILVTTRSEYIANRICTDKAYKLQVLADNVCWDIIKRYSGFEDKSNKQNLEEIGLDIAKKCGGVALAAQALGDLLNPRGLDGWSEINNSDIWNESFGADDSQHKKVLTSLKLSYEHMLPILKLCFSYCAIFPKGHDIYEDDLIHQWVALDFIKKPSEGTEYINRLLGMSFLQHSKSPTIFVETVVRYTMHDLVHDLARSVLGDELIVIDAAKKVEINQQKYCRYALLTNYYGKTKLSDILPEKVRALHFSSSSKLGPHDASFSFAKRLCILDFSECYGIILPSSICQLKQLKCLIAPKSQNKNLPDAIGELSKLQYLNLCGSSLISTLPDSIGKLNCMTYLGLSGCSSISKIPDLFGGLQSLLYLDMSNCSQIIALPGSLGNLPKLQHLDISRCDVLKKLPESFGGLNQLQHLNLSGCGSIKRLPEDIGSLNNLQYLDLRWSRRILELPESFQNLQNLVHLDLTYCYRLEGLPKALRGLISLEHLNMSYFGPFDWSWEDPSDALRNLTNLKYLNLTKCMEPSQFTSLDFIGTLTNLEHLDLSENLGIVSLPESIGNLKKLHTLNLSWCKNLMFLPDSISEITVLKSLSIDGCSDELIEQVNSKLHYSLALPVFKVIQADTVGACSNLPLLEGTNVDELRICSLENVRSLEEACKVKLLDKDKLSTLFLSWTFREQAFHGFVDDEDLLGQLVPPRGLEFLALEGYRGQWFPGWFMDISHHLPNLVSISLHALTKCNNLPPLGQLPNLKQLIVSNCFPITKIDNDFCGGKGAFRQLSSFTLCGMELEAWFTRYSIDDGVEEFMFPVLDELVIEECPRLRLTPCPPVCRVCKIKWSDKTLSSLEELSSNGHPTSSTPTTTLEISSSSSQTLRVFHHFTALQELKIIFCDELMELPECMRHLTSLRSLTIDCCASIKALPPCIQQLTKLHRLRIEYCPELKRWCESEENKKKLAHINNIMYRWRDEE